MNAGCYGGETWNHVTRIEVLTRAGIFAERTPEAYSIGYRSVCGADGKRHDTLFTAAWLEFSKGDAHAARVRIAELLRKRIATQPLNPSERRKRLSQPAGRSRGKADRKLRAQGLRDRRRAVSEKHANFIVNPEGTARAADIEAIIEHVRAVVRDRTGVDLEPEVQVIGERA
jgi:UDP-N-acetylmuramate dehydrogenase